MSLLRNFPADGAVTVNRVILRPLEERVAELCENVKIYHSGTGFIGGLVALNSGNISNEGSTVASKFKDKEALIATFWRIFEDHEHSHRSETFQPLSRQALELSQNGNKEIAYDMPWSGAAYSPDEAKAARAAEQIYAQAG